MKLVRWNLHDTGSYFGYKTKTDIIPLPDGIDHNKALEMAKKKQRNETSNKIRWEVMD